MSYFILYLALLNAVGFLLMLADKSRAKRHAWRIPERTLLGIAVLGGSIGSLAGMYLFRHKTKHRKFTIGIPLILVLQLLILSLWGCQESKPVKIVKSELNLIQKLDEETITAFISYEDMIRSDAPHPEIGGDAAEAVQLFFQDFSYRVLSSSISDNNATVNVEIKNIDARELAKDLCLELIARSITQTMEDMAPISSSTYFTLLHDILSSQKYDLVKTTAHFDLVSTEDGWHIQNSEALEDQIVGGFISCLNDPYLVMPEEICSVVFERFGEHKPEDWLAYLNMNDIFSTYSTVADKVDLALATQISKCFFYQIQDVKERDDTASAVIDITSLNMDHVLSTYLDRLLDYASTTEAVRATDTELADKTAALLIECLNSNTDTCTKTIKINFVNNGTTWEMQLGDDFTDALLGNITKAVETFQTNAVSCN